MTEATALAQDPNEPFDILDFNGQPTGQIKARADVHRDGDWHRAIHIWVAGRDGDGTAFLTFQRRSAAKDSWPNYYDTTVGGHYRAGESLADTLRETEEEIGISVEEAALTPLGVRISVTEIPPLCDHELQDVYLLLDDRPLSDYRPHPVELSALVRFPLRELLPFFAAEQGTINGVAITPHDRVAQPIIATRDEFIPSVDRYSLRIAIAAHNILRGDRYVAL